MQHALPATPGETPAAQADAMSVRQVMIGRLRFHQIGTRLLPVIAGGGDGDGDPPTPVANSASPKPADPPAPEEWDKDRGMATIRKLREDLKAAKAGSAELEDLRKKVQEAEDAKLSEQERLANEAKTHKARADQAEADLRAERTRSAIERAAVAAGFQDPEDAVLRLLDKVEHDDKGQVTNARALVDQLAKDKPYLVGQGTNGTPKPGNGTNPKPAGGATDDAVKRSREQLLATGNYAGSM